MNFGRVRVESKLDLGDNLRNNTYYKNSWEYFYYLGNADSQESKKNWRA